MHGHVEFGVYAAGSKLAGAGLVSGGGMTREAALGKLFALLGAGLDQAATEHWFALDLCGERAD
ncbi:L-asparaginase 1 [compost metagenome]